ncbi:MAG: TetR/AcrR family transcriptional regulator [Henriciella sp.]|nr:TetR/AcrR family transcriptional regulator [Henriciella sp.]
MSPAPSKPVDLKQACIDEAFAIIQSKGLEKLSLRDVARRLGVSHQAPYKHFASRDHILAAVVARCYAEFALYMEANVPETDSFESLHAMGLAYLNYAREHPLEYRLMFGSVLPDPELHEEMMQQAQYAFSLLHNKLEKLPLKHAADMATDLEKHDAIFVWSTLHGLATLLQSGVTDTLTLSQAEKAVAIERAMSRISLALDPETRGAP